MSKKRMRTALGVLSTAVATGVVLVAAQPAQAAAAYISVSEGSCSSGYACLFFDTELQGAGYGYYNDVWNMGTISSPYNSMNNQASSARNRSNSGNAVKLYDTAGGSGTARCLKSGYSSSTMYGLSNAASALVWSSTCGSVTVFPY
ncbi:peptidase inhibitor family I36 protein [Micromonospora zamorensis]|uniref:peptidase inhibitor family I36 protein n=1 Tax=Micromonospora zamorensis TaxID=709883 RepID=UPI002ED38359|nr:peptidase inhibitor family I36 protein [Micromonospora zamorensis]